jgi:hypothetical protein
VPTKGRSRGWKSGKRRYGKAASKRAASAMRRKKRGTLQSGRGGKGGRVKSRKQAIAIARIPPGSFPPARADREKTERLNMGIDRGNPPGFENRETSLTGNTLAGKLGTPIVYRADGRSTAVLRSSLAMMR